MQNSLENLNNLQLNNLQYVKLIRNKFGLEFLKFTLSQMFLTNKTDFYSKNIKKSNRRKTIHRAKVLIKNYI